MIAPLLRGRGLAHAALHVPGYTLAQDGADFDWLQWRDAAVNAVEAAIDADGPDAGEPVILGGLCMGGALAAAVALELAARAPGRVAGLVLMSPSFDFDGWGLSPLRHLRHLVYRTGLDRFFSVKERAPYGVKNTRIRAWIAKELTERAASAAGPARVPLRALREGERLLAHVRARLHQIDCPILMVHARDDEISSLASVNRLFDGLPQADKELVVLDDSYHMITIDNDRRQVVAALERFTRRVAAGSAPPQAVVAACAAAANDPEMALASPF